MDPRRMGCEEAEEKKETVVGVNKACPSIPIRALTDQRLWARAELGTTYVRSGRRFGKEREYLLN